MEQQYGEDEVARCEPSQELVGDVLSVRGLDHQGRSVSDCFQAGGGRSRAVAAIGRTDCGEAGSRTRAGLVALLTIDW